MGSAVTPAIRVGRSARMENFMVDDAKGRNKGKRKLLRADDGRHSALKAGVR